MRKPKQDSGNCNWAVVALLSTAQFNPISPVSSCLDIFEMTLLRSAY